MLALIWRTSNGCLYLSLQFGNTALNEARANNHNDVVQYLLQHQPKWKVDTLTLLQAHTYYTAYRLHTESLCSNLTLYNLCLYRLLCRCNISSPIYILKLFQCYISLVYISMSHERTWCQWLMHAQNRFHKSMWHKFNISLSSQKEIQLVEISQRLCVAISWNTFNYCIMSFLAFSQNSHSIQQQLNTLPISRSSGLLKQNSLHFDPNCKDCRHRIRVGKNGVSLTTNLVLWISSKRLLFISIQSSTLVVTLTYQWR